MSQENPPATTDNAKPLTPQERELLALYRELPPLARENAIKLFRVATEIPGSRLEDED